MEESPFTQMRLMHNTRTYISTNNPYQHSNKAKEGSWSGIVLKPAGFMHLGLIKSTMNYILKYKEENKEKSIV